MHKELTGLLLIAAAALAGCNSNGTCEYKFDESSKDGSLTAGMQLCAPKWVAEKCSEPAMSGAGVTAGLKTSGYVFTKGATCEQRGYQDCSGGRGIDYEKTCPKK